jgi:hypothetical protein
MYPVGFETSRLQLPTKKPPEIKVSFLTRARGDPSFPPLVLRSQDIQDCSTDLKTTDPDVRTDRRFQTRDSTAKTIHHALNRDRNHSHERTAPPSVNRRHGPVVGIVQQDGCAIRRVHTHPATGSIGGEGISFNARGSGLTDRPV